MENNNSRTDKSVTNIKYNFTFQILNLIINFTLRTIFIKVFTTELLGVSSLLTNILTLLSLSELGISSAFSFSMYKPIKGNDKKTITALLNYYKKVYFVIGIIIFAFGICLMPFLKYIINLNVDVPNVQLYFLIYLLTSVSSYFFVYRTSILIADQKEFYVKKYNIIFSIIKFIFQVVAMVVFKSFIFYLLVQFIVTLYNNIYISKLAKKMYPYIEDKEELDKSEKKKIWSNVKSMFTYQFGGLLLNNTDNILISIICGTVVVGYYSNYLTIFISVATFLSIFYTSIISSVGNHNVDTDSTKQYELFKKINFLTFIIYGICIVCLLCGIQDFIKFWIGGKFLLGYTIVIAELINLYFKGMLYPVWCFRNTTELFKKTSFIIIFTAIINIILSIILGIKIGLFGILFATVLARVMTNLWYEPYLLYKHYFKKNVFEYYLNEIFKIVLLAIICIFSILVCKSLVIDILFLKIITEILIGFIIFMSFIILIYHNNKEYKEFKYLLVCKIFKK